MIRYSITRPLIPRGLSCKEITAHSFLVINENKISSFYQDEFQYEEGEDIEYDYIVFTIVLQITLLILAD